MDGVSRNAQEPAVQEECGKKHKCDKRAASACDPTLESPLQGRKLKQKNQAGSHSDNTSPLLLTRNEDMGSSVSNHQAQHNSGQEPAASDNVSPKGSLGIRSGISLISKDVALPRVVLCLAHNGKGCMGYQVEAF